MYCKTKPGIIKDYAVLNVANISGEYSIKKDRTVIVL
nr:MAG TPA: hypothetical protein [Caudoviricetes sp.]